MSNTAARLTEIKKKLSRLPGHKLYEVEDFIGFLLSGKEGNGGKNVHLKGMWAGKGFERLDSKKEIKSLRKHLSESILQRIHEP